MDNKLIALIVVIVILIAGGAYYLGVMSNSTNTTATANNTTNNTNYKTHESTDHQNNSKNDTPDVKISAEEAQEIAIGSAQELGGENDTAGVPTLYKWTQNNKHTWVWHVPLYDAATGASAGAMDVDAYTGEVIMNE